MMSVICNYTILGQVAIKCCRYFLEVLNSKIRKGIAPTHRGAPWNRVLALISAGVHAENALLRQKVVHDGENA